MDVHGRIREILAETIREELAPDQQHLSTEDLIKALRRRGIIDDVMKELNFVTVSIALGGGRIESTGILQTSCCLLSFLVQ